METRLVNRKYEHHFKGAPPYNTLQLLRRPECHIHYAQESDGTMLGLPAGSGTGPPSGQGRMGGGEGEGEERRGRHSPNRFQYLNISVLSSECRITGSILIDVDVGLSDLRNRNLRVHFWRRRVLVAQGVRRWLYTSNHLFYTDKKLCRSK